MLETVESAVSGSFGHVHSWGESSEEELAVLPRHTKVVVTGNNRTKSVLVGLEGVVKKAVGLGGWHWLVLANGIEVKLQRNALSVIEAPTGHEEYNENDSESMLWNGSDLEGQQKPLRLRHRSQKTMGLTNRLVNHHRSQSKGPAASSVNPSPKVDLSKLETRALWRYLRHFNLVGADQNPSKEQLISAVQRHFVSQQLDELQVIPGFIQAAKRLKTFCN
ncbi:histone deacetylase complex subunit [Wolffia australiana]